MEVKLDRIKRWEQEETPTNMGQVVKTGQHIVATLCDE